jgi:hypothetical protein
MSIASGSMAAASVYIPKCGFHVANVPLNDPVSFKSDIAFRLPGSPTHALTYTAPFSNPPSTLMAAPLVAAASGLHK